MYSIFLTALYHKLRNLSETFTGTSTPKSVDEFIDGPHPEDSFLSSSIVCFSLTSGIVGQSFLDLPSSLSFYNFEVWFLSCLSRFTQLSVPLLPARAPGGMASHFILSPQVISGLLEALIITYNDDSHSSPSTQPVCLTTVSIFLWKSMPMCP